MLVIESCAEEESTPTTRPDGPAAFWVVSHKLSLMPIELCLMDMEKRGCPPVNQHEVLDTTGIFTRIGKQWRC